jgi:predicted phosphodiesterase
MLSAAFYLLAIMANKIPKAAVKFLIMSDTHEFDLTENIAESSFRTGISDHEIDVVLHCGDLTHNGSAESLHKAIKMLSSINAELKLVIAGNHEVSLDRDFYLRQRGLLADHEGALAIVTDPVAKAHGVVFLAEGTYQVQLKSGATFTLYASPYTPKDGNPLSESAFQYPSSHDRFNPPNYPGPRWKIPAGTSASLIPEGVDIIMTHGPPRYILDRNANGDSTGCDHLRRAIARTKPRLHCFGHIHDGYGAHRIDWESSNVTGNEDEHIELLPHEFVGRNQARKKGFANLPPASADALAGNQTLMVNAAIVDTNMEATNAPWRVELAFPVMEPFANNVTCRMIS